MSIPFGADRVIVFDRAHEERPLRRVRMDTPAPVRYLEVIEGFPRPDLLTVTPCETRGRAVLTLIHGGLEHEQHQSQGVE